MLVLLNLNTMIYPSLLTVDVTALASCSVYLGLNALY